MSLKRRSSGRDGCELLKNIKEEATALALPVVDEQGVLRGVVHLHDLLRSGVV